MSGSWKLSLPCSRAEAEAIAKGDLASLADFGEPPVLMTSEPDPDSPEEWRLDAYFEGEPSSSLIARVVELVPSAHGAAPRAEPVPEQDWVTLSQAGLAPIAAGRFYVYTAAAGWDVPSDAIAFRIEASQAFGTGHHETTTGCLVMLDRLKRRGLRFTDVADIGTGTGLLAFAAHRLWRGARVIASDIDPVSIAVSAENATINAIPLGRLPGQVELVVAPGVAHRRLAARAPYDLLIANILAGPLIDLAKDFARVLLPGGSLILAGLLDTQADQVAAAYRRQGLRLADRIDRGAWPTLRMVKRRR